MIANRMKRGLPLAAMTALVLVLIGATAADAATAPIKEVLASHIGWEVDKTTKGDICTVASGDECQFGKSSGEPGGFYNAKGIAVAANGNVYVADWTNNRVQELTSAGQFVLMFGREVNETTKGDVCTEEEITKAAVKCKAGIAGSEAGAFVNEIAVAVDPASGNVYVAEPEVNHRVDEYTAGGVFVLMLGKEVNANKTNLCLAGETCKAGVVVPGTSEHGAFVAPEALAAGGPEDLLYVGDEHRVQAFEADGKYKSEISLTGISSAAGSHVSALALDSSCSLHKPPLTEGTIPTCKAFDPGYGDVYLAYTTGGLGVADNVIHQFDTTGKETNEFAVLPRELNKEAQVQRLAVDPVGRLAVASAETGGSQTFRGGFYEVAAKSLHLITKFAAPPANGMAFNASDELYLTGGAGTALTGHEIIVYEPRPVAEPRTNPQTCVPGAEHETDVTFDCTLNGEVDPWGVKETEVWFEWGRTSQLGEKTPPQPVSNEKSKEGEEELPVKVSAVIEGVRPNESPFYYQLAGEDHNVKTPETLASERASFATPIVAPWVSEPSVPVAARFSSAVIFGELNPENADTEYFFEYAPGEALAGCTGVRRETCPGVLATPAVRASCSLVKGVSFCVYGKIGSTVEVTGLQPVTVYHYRLFAESENTPKTEKTYSKCPEKCPEGSFTTAPVPVPHAVTGAASALGATSATISGTVNPDGAPATYAFELGIYSGAATQYGIVFSGAAGAGSVPVAETLPLSGLQPGTTYAYRIDVKSGYGESVGATVTFTTAGLPGVLVVPSVLAQLSVPNIAFPKEPAKVTPKKLTRAQQLARALKACAKKPKSKRAACRRSAHKKYPTKNGKKIVNTNAKGKRKHV
jgi:NHL repeat